MDFFSGFLEDMRIIATVFQYTWFVVLPLAFYGLFEWLWLGYRRGRFYSKINWVLLELVPPPDLEKSPQLMESLYLGMSGVLTSYNIQDTYIKGAFTYRFSLEIVSKEGTVHLYIKTPANFRNLVEAHIYAQYPDAEVVEVPDYVNDVPKVVPNKDWDLWGTDLILTDPEALPIKTWRFFEEDITGNMIDPMAGLIETIGKLGPQQHIWFQLIIEPLKESWVQEGRQLVGELAGRGKPKKVPFFQGIFADFIDVLKNSISGLFGGEPKFKNAFVTEKKEEQPLEFRLTPGEKKKLEALESNIGKNVYNTKVRFLYLGRREAFDKSAVSSFMGSLKQFTDLNLNGFRPDNDTKTFANYLFKQSRLRHRQSKIFRRYVERDDGGNRCVLSTEELATLFHFPDMAVKTPFLRRVTAKRSGAPVNLPVE